MRATHKQGRRDQQASRPALSAVSGTAGPSGRNRAISAVGVATAALATVSAGAFVVVAVTAFDSVAPSSSVLSLTAPSVAPQGSLVLGGDSSSGSERPVEPAATRVPQSGAAASTAARVDATGSRRATGPADITGFGSTWAAIPDTRVFGIRTSGPQDALDGSDRAVRDFVRDLLRRESEAAAPSNGTPAPSVKPAPQTPAKPSTPPSTQPSAKPTPQPTAKPTTKPSPDGGPATTTPGPAGTGPAAEPKPSASPETRPTADQTGAAEVDPAQDAPAGSSSGADESGAAAEPASGSASSTAAPTD
jgi:hypothetical protein